MAKTVLVTGGGGPIGRYVVDALADHGVDVLGHSVGRLFDLPRLLHVVTERSVRSMVHAAEEFQPDVSIKMPVATVLANIDAALQLLEAARLTEMDGRIVVLSSSAVYGDNEGRIDESSPLRPRTPYAVTKVTAEHLASMYADVYGLDVVVLRVGDQYGPDLTPATTLRTLLHCAMDGKPFQAPSGSDHVFHLTHGEDICRAVIAALDAKAPTQRVYNISGGESHSLAQVIALVRERFPQSQIDVGPGHLPGLDRQGSLDISAADRELAYRPIWGLARGLDDYAEWLLATREAA